MKGLFVALADALVLFNMLPRMRELNLGCLKIGAGMFSEKGVIPEELNLP